MSSATVSRHKRAATESLWARTSSVSQTRRIGDDGSRL